MFLRVQLTIFEHWFWWWLGADQATSHYLNQWYPRLPTHICVTRPQWVKSINDINDWIGITSAKLYRLWLFINTIIHRWIMLYNNWPIQFIPRPCGVSFIISKVWSSYASVSGMLYHVVLYRDIWWVDIFNIYLHIEYNQTRRCIQNDNYSAQQIQCEKIMMIIVWYSESIRYVTKTRKYNRT